MLRGLLLIACSFAMHVALSQSKTLTAVKITQPPVIDGKLDDHAWNTASVATDFVQNYPSFGQPASVKSEVRFLYDDNAIYIHASLNDDPSHIRRQSTPRDAEQRQDVDYFSVSLDTYNDRQNGFMFLVTPANVQSDAKIVAGTNISYGYVTGDRTWDAVWQSNVENTADGWQVEIRIPYISLRFAKKDVQTWGLQFIRYTRRNNEASSWNPTNPNENGFINQFGRCENLVDIKPPLRLSFSPYVTAGARLYPEGFEPKREFLRNGGMDVKYGINESFTLDATLVPDFGQTISDNLINNLTPFEQKFNENRPFFTEGTELFTKASNLFYSRRIGAVPGYYDNVFDLENDYTIKENPSITQLYNAIKLSGRTKNKLGVGVFNAVTAPMYARLTNKITGKDSTIETESLTNYNMIVFDQALRGRSSLTFTNTNVIRNGAARDANVTGIDFNYYTKNNKYLFKILPRYSSVFGNTPYRGNINLVDDTLPGGKMISPYDGFRNTISFGKVSGKFRFNYTNNIESNGYDPNDMGYLANANEVSHLGTLSYYQQTPTDKFNSYNYTIGFVHSSLFKPYVYNSFEIYADGNWVFKNFWSARLFIGALPSVQNDYFELRTPNRYLQRPAVYYAFLEGNTDSRRKLYLGYGFGYNRYNIENGDYFFSSINPRYRFSDRFTLDVSITTQDDKNQVGYAFERDYMTDKPIIGYRRFLQTETIINGIYSFKPRLNLTLRVRHYWNEVKYKGFYDVSRDGSHQYRPQGARFNHDDNYNLFNLDAFLTWDFRLGSRFIVGYKNWLGNPWAVVGQRNYFGNLKGIFSNSHGNELTAKFIYFLDYNQLRKKR